MRSLPRTSKQHDPPLQRYTPTTAILVPFSAFCGLQLSDRKYLGCFRHFWQTLRVDLRRWQHPAHFRRRLSVLRHQATKLAATDQHPSCGAACRRTPPNQCLSAASTPVPEFWARCYPSKPFATDSGHAAPGTFRANPVCCMARIKSSGEYLRLLATTQHASDAQQAGAQ
jgi:hypothetical protein